ncbi:TPA: hypothetical protein ACINZ9_000665 [Streptococcus agalactiae]
MNRLREYRIKASISQLALAKSVGVARQTDLNTLFWDSRHL